LSAAGLDASVQATGRDVTVDGTVADSRDALNAQAIVAGVWGVQHVATRLQVRPTASTPASTPTSTPLPSPTPSPLWPQGSVSFDVASTTLTGPAETYLATVVTYLQRNGSVKVDLRGYADATGSADANRSLSQQRADVVASYLVGHGIGAGRLRAEGLGASRPVTSNDSPVGRSVNRRVELVFMEGN
jgi:outer membrane protein OmpA-like peptidoglycan-associated protein